MDRFFIIQFAFRNLKQHRLRAILTLAGVVIGVSAIAFLISFAFGIERLVTNEVTNGNAFLLIDVGTGNSEVITLTDSTADNIRDIDGVENVYGTTSVAAKAIFDGKSMEASFYGVDPTYLEKSGVKAAKGNDLTGEGDELLVNTAFVKLRGLDDSNVINQKTTFDIVIPKGLVGETDNIEVSNQEYRIVGVVNDDSSPKVYTNYDNLKTLGVNSYSQFKVEVASQNVVPQVRQNIENMGLKTQYVGDTVAQINQVFGIFRSILGAFGVITLIVSILGMFNTLTISLLERIKEIALMKMLGMRKKDINNTFLTESIILGFSGGILGLLLGIGASKTANLILNHYATTMGGDPVNIFYYPIAFVAAIIVTSLLVGFLTGLYPARRAVKVKALDVLRYE